MSQPEKTSEEKEKQYKAEQDFIYIVQAFDYWVQYEDLPIESSWIYDYLESKEIIAYTNEAKIKAFNQVKKDAGTEENQKRLAKLVLVKDHFEKLHDKKLHIKNQL